MPTYRAGHFFRFILPPTATGIVYFLAATITFGLEGVVASLSSGLQAAFYSRYCCLADGAEHIGT